MLALLKSGVYLGALQFLFAIGATPDLPSDYLPENEKSFKSIIILKKEQKQIR